jgi:hypothetical protein
MSTAPRGVKAAQDRQTDRDDADAPRDEERADHAGYFRTRMAAGMPTNAAMNATNRRAASI